MLKYCKRALMKKISFKMDKEVRDSLLDKITWTEYEFSFYSSLALLCFILNKIGSGYELFYSRRTGENSKSVEQIDLDIFYQSIKDHIPEYETAVEYETLVSWLKIRSIVEKEKELKVLLFKKIGFFADRDVLITATSIFQYNLLSHFLAGDDICLIHTFDKDKKTIFFNQEDLFNFSEIIGSI
jgi:hypothetical protein